MKIFDKRKSSNELSSSHPFSAKQAYLLLLCHKRDEKNTEKLFLVLPCLRQKSAIRISREQKQFFMKRMDELQKNTLLVLIFSITTTTKEMDYPYFVEGINSVLSSNEYKNTRGYTVYLTRLEDGVILGPNSSLSYVCEHNLEAQSFETVA